MHGNARTNKIVYTLIANISNFKKKKSTNVIASQVASA